MGDKENSFSIDRVSEDTGGSLVRERAVGDYGERGTIVGVGNDASKFVNVICFLYQLWMTEM